VGNAAAIAVVMLLGEPKTLMLWSKSPLWSKP